METFNIGNSRKDFYVLDWYYEYYLPVKGFEDLYEVSNWGNVRRIKCKRNNSILITDHNQYGHKRVTLCRNGVHNRKGVHQLVMAAFKKNPNNLPMINHRDEDPTNNSVWNLEYCDAKYNRNYGTATERMIATRNRLQTYSAERPVIQMDLEGNEINRFKSVSAAAIFIKGNDVSTSFISRCCNNKAKSAWGYKWKYA